MMPNIRIISLRRLMEGGAAMFAAHRRNHQRAMWGEIIISPLEIKILRVFVVS